MIPSGPSRRRFLPFLTGAMSQQVGLLAGAHTIVFAGLLTDGSSFAAIGRSQMATLLLPVLLALPLGVLADRVSRRAALAWTGTLSAAVLASLALATWLGAVAMPHLVPSALLLAVLYTSGELSRDAHAPTAVGRDRLVPVNAAVALVAYLGFFAIAPLFDPGTLPIALAVAALGFAASVLLFRAVEVPEEPVPPRTGWWRESAEGVRFTLTHPVLRAIATYLVAVTVLHPLLDDLVVPPGIAEGTATAADIALLEWVISLATPAGALLALLLYRRVGVFRLSWLAILVTQPFALLLVPAEAGPLWYVLGKAVPWLGATVTGVTLLSHRQMITPGRLQGRTGATLVLLLGMASVAGSVLEALTAYLMEPLDAGTRWPIVVLAATGLTAAAVPLFRVRQLVTVL
ncbi:MFS transporter [Nonomuraea africana]|uniref:MFS transporter n=1 Tax=Nonomuraea africana TaxID=46171 RepID=A0ABR9KDJ1_9ACTN|nr:hypothetical protein [Nonomuraea africana]MBE1560005.1 hypothetical protein [Nonomuraea africana]